MKRFLTFAILMLMVSALAGCFQMDMLIKVNPDGSGTLEQTVLMRREFMEQMRAMAQSFAQEGQPQEKLSLLDENELREKAGNLGKGVEYVKAEEIVTDTYEGYKAVFSFKNINQLNVDQNPGSSLPSDEGEEQPPQEFITFKLKKGKTSELTITMPEDKDEPAPESTDEATEEQEEAQEPTDPQQEQIAMAMMKEMLRGMRVGIAVEVNGKIKKTNASFQNGNRLTLMDMDFDKLLAVEEEFKKFAKANPEKMSTAKELMQNVPGIKMETEKVVTVKFK